MFSNKYKFGNFKLAPNSPSDVKVIEITPYSWVNGTEPFEEKEQFEKYQKICHKKG